MSDELGWRGDDDVVAPKDAALAHVPFPPRQPSARARELVFRYQGGQKAILLIGVIFFAVGCFFVVVPAMAVRDAPQRGVVALVMMIFPIVGALMMFFAIRSNRREIRAFTDGKAMWAKVVFAGPDRTVRINGRHPYKVEWKLTVAGIDYEGSLSSMSQDAIADLLSAKEVIVLYDTVNPVINTVYIA